MDNFLDVFAQVVLSSHFEDDGVVFPMKPSAAVTSSYHRMLPFGSGSSGGTKHRLEYTFTAKSVAIALVNVGASKDALNMQLLGKFIQARLMHCPTDRTLEMPQPSTILQPSAKGWAVLALYCKGDQKQEDHYVTVALASAYNTMHLVPLERSAASRRLLVSTGVSMVLWHRMLGEKCNVYSISGSGSPTPNEDTTSPYYHRYFTHPSTNSVVQYYDSHGIRIFSNLRLISGRCVSYALSGKAVWQWILECTTVETPAEATCMARLVLTQGFVHRIDTPIAEAVAYDDGMPPDLSRQTLYSLTARGRRLCAWGDDLPTSVDTQEPDSDVDNLSISTKLVTPTLSTSMSDSDTSDNSDPQNWRWESLGLPPGLRVDKVFSEVLTLELVLKEPGLKMLFRTKLRQWHNEEALLFFDEVRRYSLLREALVLADKSRSAIRASKIAQYAVKVLALVRRRYIEVGAPYEINISDMMRTRLLASMAPVLDDTVESRSMTSRDILQTLGLISSPLEATFNHVSDLLRYSIPRLASCEEMREIPLRTYILANPAAYGLDLSKYLGDPPSVQQQLHHPGGLIGMNFS